MEDETMPVPELYTAVPTSGMETGGITPGSPADVAVVAGITGLWFLFIFGTAIIMIMAFWKIFTKAGEKGWKALIPFYNTWILLEISGKPGWWLFLMFIPFVNIVIVIIMWLGLFKAFGKSWWWVLLLLIPFVNIIVILMVAFGSATYTKSVAEGDSGNTPPQNPTPTQTQETPPQNTQQPTV